MMFERVEYICMHYLYIYIYLYFFGGGLDCNFCTAFFSSHIGKDGIED